LQIIFSMQCFMDAALICQWLKHATMTVSMTLNKEVSSPWIYSTQSTPRVVQPMQQSSHANSQQHANGHVTTHSSSSSHRTQRKNVISCVTVGDSDGEASPSRTHAHLYLPQHPQHQQTTQLIKHEPQQQHHVSRWALNNNVKISAKGMIRAIKIICQ